MVLVMWFILPMLGDGPAPRPEECSINLKVINAAIEEFKAEHNALPMTLEQLVERAETASGKGL